MSTNRQMDIIALKVLLSKDYKWLSAGIWAMVPVVSPGLREQNGSGWASDQYGRFYVDPECLDHSLETKKAALKHEHGHIWGEHFRRAERRGCGFSGPMRRIANLAGDLELHGNDPYYRKGFLRNGSEIRGVFPEDFGLPDGLIFEQYLEALLKKWEDEQEEGDDKAPPSRPGEEEGKGEGSGEPGESGESGQSGSPGGRGDSGEPFPEFDHDCGSGAGPGEQRPWELGPPDEENPGLDPDQQEDIRRRMARDIKAAVERGELRRGDSGSFWIDWAEEVIPPHTIPWEEKIQQLVVTASQLSQGYEDFSFLRASRRDYGDVLMPGMFEVLLNLVAIRDVSSSMSDAAVRAGNRELEGILNTVADELTVIDCDTQALNHGAVSSMRELNGRGHGGTDLRRAFEMIKSLDEPPHVIVVWTDGGTPWPAENPGIPTIVCLTGEGWGRAPLSSLPSWAYGLEVPL